MLAQTQKFWLNKAQQTFALKLELSKIFFVGFIDLIRVSISRIFTIQCGSISYHRNYVHLLREIKFNFFLLTIKFKDISSLIFSTSAHAFRIANLSSVDKLSLYNCGRVLPSLNFSRDDTSN